VATITVNKIDKLRALGDTILVTDMEFKERIMNGIIILDDNMKSKGIRARWAKIYAIGPDVDDDQISLGKYVLIAHGRWTRGITVEDSNGEHVIRKIDNKDILMVSDSKPVDSGFGIEN
jgi:co-chaperonin GroES (HSP10)